MLFEQTMIMHSIFLICLRINVIRIGSNVILSKHVDGYNNKLDNDRGTSDRSVARSFVLEFAFFVLFPLLSFVSAIYHLKKLCMYVKRNCEGGTE